MRSILLLALAIVPLSSRPPEQVLETSLGAVWIPAAEFQELLRVAQATAFDKEDLAKSRLHVSITVSNPGESHFATSLADLEPILRSRSGFAEARATFRLDSAPVSSVELTLSDSMRRVSVTGESPDKVRSVHATLVADLRAHETLFAGRWFRFGMWWVIFGVIGYAIHRADREPSPGFVRLKVLLYPAAVVIPASALIPTDRWLAGFWLMRDGHWYELYAPELGLMGLVLGILGCLPILLSWVHKRNQSAGMSAAEPTQNATRGRKKRQAPPT
jgi:hypothetical protein